MSQRTLSISYLEKDISSAGNPRYTSSSQPALSPIKSFFMFNNNHKLKMSFPTKKRSSVYFIPTIEARIYSFVAIRLLIKKRFKEVFLSKSAVASFKFCFKEIFVTWPSVKITFVYHYLFIIDFE